MWKWDGTATHIILDKDTRRSSYMFEYTLVVGSGATDEDTPSANTIG